MADEKYLNHTKNLAFFGGIIAQSPAGVNPRPTVVFGQLRAKAPSVEGAGTAQAVTGGEQYIQTFSPSVKTLVCHLPHQREAFEGG